MRGYSDKLLVLGMLGIAACSTTTTTTTSGQPISTGSTSNQTVKSTESATSTSQANVRSLDQVEACPLLDAGGLPAAWQPLTSDPDPIVEPGDSNCSIDQSGTGLGISISVYRGPGEGVDELSENLITPAMPVEVAGRNGRIFRDGTICGIIFGFGPDQGLMVTGSVASGSTEDPCGVATIAATAMMPNLPPS